MRLLALLALTMSGFLASGAEAAAPALACSIDQPISAAAINAGGTWTWRVTGGTPNTTYAGRIEWKRDPYPGNGANTGIVIDEFGNGATTLPGAWSGGSLPGTGIFGFFVAKPGTFRLYVFPSEPPLDEDGNPIPWSEGSTHCSGTVTA